MFQLLSKSTFGQEFATCDKHAANLAEYFSDNTDARIPKLQPRERLFTLEELVLFNASFQVVHWLNFVRMNRRESETAWLMETVQLYSGFLFLLDIRYPP